MNFIKSFIVLVFLLINLNAIAQANLLNAVIPQEIGQLNDQQLATSDNEPLAYGPRLFGKKLIWMRELISLIITQLKMLAPTESHCLMF
jgi:hypothetical protein